MQASEKLYRAAEEAVKAMAEALELPEAVEARRRGRWSMRLLDLAAQRLAERLGRMVYDDWDHAYFLHTEGFHEARPGKGQVEARAGYVRELLEIARKVVLSEGQQ